MISGVPIAWMLSACALPIQTHKAKRARERDLSNLLKLTASAQVGGRKLVVRKSVCLSSTLSPSRLVEWHSRGKFKNDFAKRPLNRAKQANATGQLSDGGKVQPFIEFGATNGKRLAPAVYSDAEADPVS